MDELNSRFELVRLELTELQNTVRAYDTILFQVKGWCVTINVAVAGFAVTSGHRALLGLAAAVVVAFYMADAYYKSIQRSFIERSRSLGQSLNGGVKEALMSPDLGVWLLGSDEFWSGRLSNWRRLLRAGRQANVYGMYLLMALLVGATWLFLGS